MEGTNVSCVDYVREGMCFKLCVWCGEGFVLGGDGCYVLGAEAYVLIGSENCCAGRHATVVGLTISVESVRRAHVNVHMHVVNSVLTSHFLRA